MTPVTSVSSASYSGKISKLQIVIASGAALLLAAGLGALVMRVYDSYQAIRPDSENQSASTRQDLASETASVDRISQANMSRESANSNEASGSAGEPSFPADLLTVPRDRWQSTGIKLQVVRRDDFSTTVRVNGKVMLNQDHVAHVFPMVEGAVEHVYVQLGEQVQADDLLATIHSREIGSAKVELFQARLLREMAIAKNELQAQVASNVTELILALRDQMPIEQIESSFRNRPMGEYRERLLAAYSSFLKSAADVKRLQSITDSGAVSGKQLLSAEANRNADLATYQSRMDQIQTDLQTATLLSSQNVKAAETGVAVAESSLRILGCREDEIAEIDPARQGEEISHYSVRAPFDGTVLSKDVVLGEQVRPDVMLVSIADLRTVWIAADLYQEHIPLLATLHQQTIRFRSDAWPEEIFEASVFFAGETVDDATRTVTMRAIADNSRQLLKPGMFVTVDLPIESQPDAIQVPPSAVQEHDGQKFVFVYQAPDQFEPRKIQTGPSSRDTVIVRDGLQPDESIVAQGGFILKSQMLADLLGEE